MTTHVGILPLDILHALSIDIGQRYQQNRSEDSNGLCFIRLPHPRTNIPSLFLPCHRGTVEGSNPKSSKTFTTLLEVQAVAPPDARSWFLKEEVVNDGKMVIMTPIDPAFLLIPILQAAHPNDGSPGIFRPADDIFDDAAHKLGTASQSQGNLVDVSFTMLSDDIIRFASMEGTKRALKQVCDVKEITPEIVVYRFSLDKLVEYLRLKVARLATPKVLEVSRTLVRGLAKDGLMEDGKEGLLEAGRIRAASDLLSQYLPANIRAALIASYDFSLLDAYLRTAQDDVAALAIANSDTPDVDNGTKGPNVDAKKRKGIKGSQGVEKLKKVNVDGMAKLSSFFKKT